jgi:integrase
MTRKRRGRGEGGIHQRADGLWVGTISLGTNAAGKRLRKSVYGTTKKAVQEALRKVQDEMASGVDLTLGKLTVSGWLTRWLTLINPTVEPGTYGPYERHVRLHIVPHIGKVAISKLAAVHIQGLYASLASSGVSPALQRKVGTTLTVALNAAARLDLIRGNPAEKVAKPKAAKPDIAVFDPEQVGRFLQAVRSDRLYPYYLTAFDSGARPGELFALLWNDVDFEGGFISINKSLEEIGGIQRIKEPKTAKSRRRIDLSADTLNELANLRKDALAAGRIDAPVFHDTTGGYLRQSNLARNSFKPALLRAGLPAVGLYTARHTCASLLLLADQPAKVVSERLGHSSVTLTLDTYSHVLPTMQKRAASVLGGILGAAQKKSFS